MNIIELLIRGRIDEAQILIAPDEDIPSEVNKWAYQSGNMTVYTLAIKGLLQNESLENHHLCSYVMSMPLCYYNGGYSLALYHAKRMLALDPTNPDRKRYLIMFYEIPERLIPLDEAVQLARDVLKEDPECDISKQVLEDYNKKKVQ